MFLTLHKSFPFLRILNFSHQSKKLKYVSQQTIKKSSDMKSKLEDVILGGGSARTEFLSRRKQSGTSASTGMLLGQGFQYHHHRHVGDLKISFTLFLIKLYQIA